MLGIPVILETDHKPLVQILMKKNIDELTPRLQRFRIRLMKYNYEVQYLPGKQLVVADCLSRNPLEVARDEIGEELLDASEAQVNMIVSNISIAQNILDRIRHFQNLDPICKQLKQFCTEGWPVRTKLSKELQPYYQYQYEISYNKGYLLKANRIIIPPPLQLYVLQQLHKGHLGINKCRARERSSLVVGFKYTVIYVSGILSILYRT